MRRSIRGGRPAAVLGVAILCLVLAAVGCSKRAPRPGPEDATTSGAGIIDEGISPGDGSSLDLAQAGQSPGEGGALRDVRFDYDSAEIDDAGRAVLDENLTWMRDHEQARLELEGHCDDRGTIEYNLALGARRARAVQEYLVAQGVAAERLKTIGYGKELPLCREQTEECWARNRRVHTAVTR